jgi:hypothetical protein
MPFYVISSSFFKILIVILSHLSSNSLWLLDNEHLRSMEVITGTQLEICVSLQVLGFVLPLFPVR